MARRRCSRTGKARFSSRLESNLTLSEIQRSNSAHRHRKHRDEPIRSYSCEFCRGWHLTSQPERRSLTS